VKWNRTESGSWAATASVLGGGSSINAGIFMKETRDGEFFKEHPFLQWDQVQKSYDKVSEIVAHERESSSRFQNCMTKAMKEAGLGEADIRTDTAHFGIYHPHSLFSTEGERHSAACLLPTDKDPAFGNLTIKTHVCVTRILFNTQGSEPRAIGIEFDDNSGEASTKRQIIEQQAEFYLSAGAIHTPQLLMLSGIGSVAALARHKIDLILDNPHVGLHLKDKPVIPLGVNSSLPIDHTIADTMAMAQDFQIGTISGGQMALQMASLTLGMLPTKYRSPTKRKAMKKLVQLLPKPLFNRINQQFVVYLILNNPLSEGSITLSSADPHASLKISSPGLNQPEEITAMTKALLAAKNVISTSPLQPYRRDLTNRTLMRRLGQCYSSWYHYGEKTFKGTTPVTFPVLPDLSSLDEKSQLVVTNEITTWLQGMYVEGWNYTSTARFGDVVNEDFTVMGVGGLRIVDASVLRRPPRVNAQATLMMLGMYAGEIADA
jgi:choline dehydrogenase-like flavoprotein